MHARRHGTLSGKGALMKNRFAITAIAVLLTAGNIPANTLPGSISREPLITAERPDKLTIGIDYERISRDVDFNNSGSSLLEAQSYCAYIGYDTAPWQTFFITIGSADSRMSSMDIDTDQGLKCSIGLHMNFLEFAVQDPKWLAGNITVKGAVEVGRYSFSSAGQDVSWFEYSASLPFGLEFFADGAPERPREFYSLALSLGPTISFMRGKAGADTVSFDSSRIVNLWVHIL